MAFPTSPTDGQFYTNALGTQYQYDSTDGAWKISGSTLVGLTGLQGVTGIGSVSGGTGTTNRVVKFLNGSAGTLCNSVVFDDGTKVGVGLDDPAFPLEVSGSIGVSGYKFLAINGTSLAFGGIDIGTSRSAAIMTDATQRLHIDRNGYVGITTQTPGDYTSKLVISNADNDSADHITTYDYNFSEGKYSILGRHDTDQTHDVTSVLPGNAYYGIRAISGDCDRHGGLRIIGAVSSDANNAVRIEGIAASTVTAPCVTVNATKSSGSGDQTSLTSSELAFSIQNNGATISQMLGDGAYEDWISYGTAADFTGFSSVIESSIRYRHITKKLIELHVYVNGTSDSNRLYFILPFNRDASAQPGAWSYFLGNGFGFSDGTYGVCATWNSGPSSGEYEVYFNSAPVLWATTNDKIFIGTFMIPV